jgi:hypothetical protein
MNALFDREAKRFQLFFKVFFDHSAVAKSLHPAQRALSEGRFSMRNAARSPGVASGCVALRHHAVGADSAMR